MTSAQHRAFSRSDRLTQTAEALWAMLCLLLTLAGAACSRERPKAPASATSEAEQVADAADIPLSNLAGGDDVSLRWGRGKSVVVSLWASWCKPCRKELPELARFAASLRPEELLILAVSVDEEQQDAVQLLSALGLNPTENMLYLHDHQGELVEALRPHQMPTTYIFDSEGRLRKHHVGYHEGDLQRWESELQQLTREVRSAP